MADGKQDIGKSPTSQERSLVERASGRMHGAVASAATGQESSVTEDDAAANGAEVLFELPNDGFVSALAIMLIPPKEEKEGRRIAAVAAPFGFVGKLSRKERIAVITPRGYVTDFASIPPFGQIFISPFGKHAEAAVIHDWLYTMGKKGDKKGRRMADKAFIKALKLLHVNWFKRQIMYMAVRFGGESGYGLDGDFEFRNLDDAMLARVDPKPPREPFAASYRTREIPKPAKAGKAVKSPKGTTTTNAAT